MSGDIIWAACRSCLTVYALGGVGAYLAYRGKLPRDLASKMAGLTVSVFYPCLMVRTAAYVATPEAFRNLAVLVLLPVLHVMAGLLLARLVLAPSVWWKGQSCSSARLVMFKRTVAFAMAFCNTGDIPVTVVASLGASTPFSVGEYADETGESMVDRGIGYVSLYSLLFNVLVWTLLYGSAEKMGKESQKIAEAEADERARRRRQYETLSASGRRETESSGAAKDPAESGSGPGKVADGQNGARGPARGEPGGECPGAGGDDSDHAPPAAHFSDVDVPEQVGEDQLPVGTGVIGMICHKGEGDVLERGGQGNARKEELPWPPLAAAGAESRPGDAGEGPTGWSSRARVRETLLRVLRAVREPAKRILSVPPLIATLVGVFIGVTPLRSLFFCSGCSPPLGWVVDLLRLFGAAAVPTSMLVVGSSLFRGVLSGLNVRRARRSMRSLGSVPAEQLDDGIAQSLSDPRVSVRLAIGAVLTRLVLGASLGLFWAWLLVWLGAVPEGNALLRFITMVETLAPTATIVVILTELCELFPQPVALLTMYQYVAAVVLLPVGLAASITLSTRPP